MTCTKLLTIICLCVLVGLAGCDTSDRPAQVTIHLEHASVKGEQAMVAVIDPASRKAP
jgi:hypothetical protein